jgi:pimeloyl-ACP methyl ester carboxylesterase
MATAITMPRLGLSMVEGTVTGWRVRPGEPVTKGQVLLTVESEKAEVEVEAFDSGILAHIYAAEGTTLPVGALLGAIVSPGEAFDPDAFAAGFVPLMEGAPATDRRPAEAGPSAEPAGPPRAALSPGLKVSPAARALARKLGVSLEGLRGSGPGGRILPEDVERAAAGRVAVGRTFLAVETRGEGPTLLFVNGFGVDASGWKRQVEDLAVDHRTVVYDHRGTGASGPIGPEEISIERLAEDALEVLAHVGGGPAVVVGISMGAAIARELAQRKPDVVRTLVLLAPVVEADPLLRAVLEGWAAIEEPDARARAMLPWLLSRESLARAGRREAVTAALRAMAARVPTESLRRHAAALFEWLESQRERPVDPAIPALVVAAGADLLVPAESVRKFAAAWPSSRFEQLPTGHAVMIEDAAGVDRLIREAARR